jgi:hypothetical protein
MGAVTLAEQINLCPNEAMNVGINGTDLLGLFTDGTIICHSIIHLPL